MPSFRDLRGNAVDEVDSRGGPSVRAPEVVDTDRAVVQAATKRVLSRREASDGTPREVRDDAPREPVARVVTGVIPADFEAGVVALEATLVTLDELAAEVSAAVARARVQLAGLRARAEQDADRLAKVEEIVRVLQSLTPVKD